MVYVSSFSYGFEGHNVVGVDRFGGVDDISMFFLGEFIPDVRADSLTNSGGYVHVARAKKKRARVCSRLLAREAREAISSQRYCRSRPDPG